ncbi:MAG: hypothetical protein ACI9CO_000053 [Candidatus Azotimanducaceae bacterium]|jgi:hypothetical protein
MSNPVSFTLTKPKGGIISCLSNATFVQRVTITLGTTPSATVIVFQGHGENLEMLTADKKDNVSIPQSDGDLSVTALFEYSPSGPSGPFTNAQRVYPPKIVGESLVQITVMSEDGADTDHNDSYLTISYMKG